MLMYGATASSHWSRTMILRWVRRLVPRALSGQPRPSGLPLCVASPRGLPRGYDAQSARALIARVGPAPHDVALCPPYPSFFPLMAALVSSVKTFSARTTSKRMTRAFASRQPQSLNDPHRAEVVSAASCKCKKPWFAVSRERSRRRSITAHNDVCRLYPIMLE